MKKSIVFCALTFFKSAYAQTFERKPASGLNITYNKSLLYNFDIEANCISKCKLNDYINIVWSKSITDYASLLQSALDELSVDGGTLYLNAGTYIVSTQLEMSSNTCLIGADTNTTIIKLMDAALPFQQSGLVRSKIQTGITVSDITLDGNRIKQKTDLVSSYGRYGFFAEVVDYVFLNKVKIMNCQGYGFDPHGNKVKWANHLIIVDCESYNNGIDGFTLDQTNGISFFNNIASKNDRHGVNVVTGSTDGLIFNGTYESNGNITKEGCGVAIQDNGYGTNNWTVTTNNITNNYNDGICIRNATNVLVQNNDIFKNRFDTTYYCLGVENSSNVNITNNYCYGNLYVRDKSNVNLVVADNNVFVTPKRLPSKPDPTCKNGIIYKNICCVKGCVQCGGTSCSTDALGADNCCESSIILSGDMCTQYSAPCNIGGSVNITPSPAVTVSPIATPAPSVVPPVPTAPTVVPAAPTTDGIPSTKPVSTIPPSATTSPTDPKTIPPATAAPTVPTSSANSIKSIANMYVIPLIMILAHVIL